MLKIKALFISPKKNEVDIRKVCKNALEKYIFSGFFTVHQTEKIHCVKVLPIFHETL